MSFFGNCQTGIDIFAGMAIKMKELVNDSIKQLLALNIHMEECSQSKIQSLMKDAVSRCQQAFAHKADTSTAGRKIVLFGM